MTRAVKLWLGLGLAAAVVLGWVFRYETISVQAGRVPAAYVVNRWTAATYFMRGSTIHQVEPMAKLTEIDYEPAPLKNGLPDRTKAHRP